MTKGNLILTDVLTAVSIALVLIGTKGDFTLPTAGVVIVGVGYSFFRHVVYFKTAKRIY